MGSRIGERGEGYSKASFAIYQRAHGTIRRQRGIKSLAIKQMDSHGDEILCLRSIHSFCHSKSESNTCKGSESISINVAASEERTA